MMLLSVSLEKHPYHNTGCIASPASMRLLHAPSTELRGLQFRGEGGRGKGICRHSLQFRGQGSVVQGTRGLQFRGLGAAVERASWSSRGKGSGVQRAGGLQFRGQGSVVQGTRGLQFRGLGAAVERASWSSRGKGSGVQRAGGLQFRGQGVCS